MNLNKRDKAIALNLGSSIFGTFFEFEGSTGGLVNFIIELCQHRESVQDEIADLKKSVLSKLINKEAKKSLEWHLKELPDPCIPPVFAIGFALGQQFDILDPEAQKEVDFILRKMKEEQLFMVFSRQRESGSRRQPVTAKEKKGGEIDLSHALTISGVVIEQ